MLENVKKFLKNTFTYEEASQAQTPEVEKAPSSQAERAAANRAAAQAPKKVIPSTSFARPEDEAKPKPVVSYTTDPQFAARQQAENFAAMRPKTPKAEQFRMVVKDVFFAKGSGVVIKGEVAQGIAKVGMKTLIVHTANKSTVQTRIMAIESSGNLVNSAITGTTVGILLDGLTRNDVHSGDVIGEI